MKWIFICCMWWIHHSWWLLKWFHLCLCEWMLNAGVYFAVVRMEWLWMTENVVLFSMNRFIICWTNKKMLCVVVIGQIESICWMKGLHFSIPSWKWWVSRWCACDVFAVWMEWSLRIQQTMTHYYHLLSWTKDQRCDKSENLCLWSRLVRSKAWNHFKATRIFLIH